MPNHLFAYGTLRPGLAPDVVAALVAQLRVLGQGTVHGLLYDLGDYPGLLHDPTQESRVHGTVFELNGGEDLLRRLDDYEGFYPHAPAQSLFLRETATVTLADGGELDCWLYLYNHPPGTARLIPSGIYRRQ
ncbi:MAG: gamma-glutamylcyclotransferase [Acidobacteriota bacterium]|nr:gamma-glutamylcyclotransferase [Acidobacteriota bacterium]